MFINIWDKIIAFSEKDFKPNRIILWYNERVQYLLLVVILSIKILWFINISFGLIPHCVNSSQNKNSLGDKISLNTNTDIGIKKI